MASAKDAADIASRLAFIGLDGESLKALTSVEHHIVQHLPQALGHFYNKLAQVPEVTRFFSGAGQMNRAQSSQLAHWTAIATGKFDDAYVEASRRIGLRHAQIGLEPRWYIGGYGVIVEGLIQGVVTKYVEEHLPAKRHRLGWGAPTSNGSELAEGLSDVLSAMVKCVLMDIDMAVTVYFEKLISDQQAKDRESAARIESAAEITGQVLQQLANGDLTGRITSEFEGGFSKIKDDTNAMADRFASVMRQLQEAASHLRVATGEILTGANDLSSRTVRQAAAIQETTISVEQLAQTVQDNANSAKQASSLSERAAATAEAGGAVMLDVKSAMVNITDCANKISAIIGMIDDIAFQTNLLALNASVEAARAGEAGKSFAVVAGEVRRLAASAATASGEVKQLVEDSLAAVLRGDALVSKANDVFGELKAAVKDSHGEIDAISQASVGQSLSLREILTAIRQMDEMTQHNAALVEQTNAAIEQAEAQASELDGIVDQFTLDRKTDGRGLRLVS